MASFSAAVDAWVLKSKKRMEAVFKESAQRVIAEAQKPVGGGGNMPVDTGFLRASIQISVSEMPRIKTKSRPDPKAGAGTYPAPQTFALATVQLGQTLYVGYTASYAGFQENRRGFVRLAAMQWPKIVSRVTQEARQRASSGGRDRS